MTGKRGRRKAVAKGKSPKKTDDHAGNVWLPPAMVEPRAFFNFAPSSACVFAELGEQHQQQFETAAPAYTSSKPACCSTDILKEICGRIRVCASHLNTGLFAFVIKFAYLFIHLFFQCFYYKNAIGRDRSATRAP